MATAASAARLRDAVRRAGQGGAVRSAIGSAGGGERREWREGEAMAFDDTYEHEAWNRGSRTRVVLIIDVWNPHLTAAERDAVAVLVGAMGDFNKAAGI